LPKRFLPTFYSTPEQQVRVVKETVAPVVAKVKDALEQTQSTIVLPPGADGDN
jgi:hypothetical protein